MTPETGPGQDSASYRQMEGARGAPDDRVAEMRNPDGKIHMVDLDAIGDYQTPPSTPERTTNTPPTEIDVTIHAERDRNGHLVARNPEGRAWAYNPTTEKWRIMKREELE